MLLFSFFFYFLSSLFLRAKAEMVRRTALANSQIRCRREGGAFGFHLLYVCVFPYFVFFFFSLFFSSSIFFTNKRPKMAGRKKLPSLAYFRHTTNFNPFNDRALRKGRRGVDGKKKTHQKAINLGPFNSRFVRFISKINHFPMQIQQKKKRVF